MIEGIVSFALGAGIAYAVAVFRPNTPKCSPMMATLCGGIVQLAHKTALCGDQEKIRAHLHSLAPELTRAAFEAKHTMYNSEERVKLAAVQLAIELVSAAIQEEKGNQ